MFLGTGLGFINKNVSNAAEIDFSEANLENSDLNVEISEILSFDELVDLVATENNITVTEAQEELGFTEVTARMAKNTRATYRTLSAIFS